MYFYFNPFSVQSRFTMYHYTSMHTHKCTHVSDARAIYIMQIDFAEFCRGQSVTAANRARNLRLQTRKMRVKIQFCELKILPL